MQPKAEDLPLQAKVVDDTLVIRIGVATLKFAFEEADSNHEWDGGHSRKKFVILDASAFAQDVALAMNDEAETLTSFLDAMMAAAVDDGSIHVEEAAKAAAPMAEE